MGGTRVSVFLLCSGLGNVVRGYESFTEEVFSLLSKDTSLDVSLFKGGGSASQGTIVLWNLSRSSSVTNLVARIVSKPVYWLEQVTFSLALLPYLMLRRPTVVYFSDGTVGNVLWHIRRSTRLRFKLLLCNGGPLYGDMSRWDFVQQVAPIHLSQGELDGLSPERQTLLPYGVALSPEFRPIEFKEKRALRCQLDLPMDRPIVLSVGVLGRTHKRMDYVIAEMEQLIAASLEKGDAPKPYLVLLGQKREESQEIVELAERVLGDEYVAVRTVPHYEIADYYRVADVFVLASLWEGLARAFLEAMSHGLPCVAHDYDVSRYVLGDFGVLRDLRVKGELRSALEEVLSTPNCPDSQIARHRSVYSRFSWDVLGADYVQLLHDVALRGEE